MKIGLVDIDSHNFPNLVLMKLSAYHKAQGDEVSLLKPNDVLNGYSLFEPWNKLYGACVFAGNESICKRLEAAGVEVGGTGSPNKTKKLPDEVEHMMPDYSLYGITDTAYGYLIRGCPRGCPFCVVADKEGKASRQVAEVDEFWAGRKKIKLLDPNILACGNHMDLLKSLGKTNAWIDFTQGIDARLLTDENSEALCNLRIELLHFAWDSPKDTVTPKKLKEFRARTKMRSRDMVVYVLTNYWSTHEEGLYRVKWLKDNGYKPFVMIYDKQHAPRETKDLARWANNRKIFCVCEFEDYEREQRTWRMNYFS